MPSSIPALVDDLRQTLADQMRVSLEKQDKQWLIEEIIRLKLKNVTLGQILQFDAQLQQQAKESQYAAETADEQASRLERIHEWQLDEAQLALRRQKWAEFNRNHHEQIGHIVDVPAKGGALITYQQRSAAGSELLRDAKDLLYALLFGAAHNQVNLPRVQRELLSITVPHNKRYVLDFMMAVTELSAVGSWNDPDGDANDERARNVVMEIEYGEAESEMIGAAISTCLNIINDLEINEVILYHRTSNIENSSL